MALFKSSTGGGENKIKTRMRRNEIKTRGQFVEYVDNELCKCYSMFTSGAELPHMNPPAIRRAFNLNAVDEKFYFQRTQNAIL